MRKRRFIANVFIMTGSMLLIRLVGMGANIYITARLGAKAMGIYHMLLSVFTFGITFAGAGVGFPVTRLVSEQRANEEDILKKALTITTAMSIVGVLVLYFGAPYIESRFIKEPHSVYALRMICVSLPFISASSVYRGYFIARRKASVITISSIIEESVCIGVTILFLSKFKNTPYAYMCLVYGCTFSNITAFVADRCLCRKCIKNSVSNPCRASFRSVFAICVPIALGSYLRTGLTTAENLIIPLTFAGYGISDAVGEYGSIKAMAMMVVMFPAVFIQAFSSMLVPEMSELNAKGMQKGIRHIASLSVSAVVTFSCYAALMLVKHHSLIAGELFKDTRAVYYLGMLSVLAVPMYLDTVADNILKGLNLQNVSLKYNIIDSLIRIALIFVFMKKYGPVFYIAMLYISEIFNLSLSLGKVARVTKLKFMPMEFVVIPLLCSIIAYTFNSPIVQTVVYWAVYFVMQKKSAENQHSL